MLDIKEEVFLGVRDRYNEKLAKLANLAQPETWSFGKDRDKDPYRILRNYFQFTYNRLSEESKILTSKDGLFRCMNTGLMTKYNQDIVAIFSQSKENGEGKLPWYLNGFFKETDRFFTSTFDSLPELASYVNNPEDLIFNQSYEIRIQKEHVIDDNYERFVTAGYTDKELISALLDSAKSTLLKKLVRNFKLALPFYYRNSETNEKKIQLLVPIYFPGANVKLAFVLNKLSTREAFYYEAITVLPVEWAYMNARLIVRPDEEWARIIEESDSDGEEEIRS